jgi:hypothetical protein
MSNRPLLQRIDVSRNWCVDLAALAKAVKAEAGDLMFTVSKAIGSPRHGLAPSRYAHLPGRMIDVDGR